MCQSNLLNGRLKNGGLAQAEALIGLALNADAAAGVRRALLVHGWLVLVVGTGYALRVGWRSIGLTLVLSIGVILLASVWKTDGVGGLQASEQTQHATIILGVGLLIAEAIVGVWLWRGSRIWREQRPPLIVETSRTRRRSMIWSGTVLVIALIYALTILVILPRFFPDVDPKGARRLEYQRQIEAWKRAHGHSAGPTPHGALAYQKQTDKPGKPGTATCSLFC